MKDILRILNLVGSYESKRKKIEDVYIKHGERYNIFEILHLSTSEVRLHSAILASLLSPGRHGADTAFLKEFLKIPRLHIEDVFFDYSRVTVEVEKYIGPLTETNGGRIDIILSDGKNGIIIENKIDAIDQKNQLLRYHNYKTNFKLVYLTKYGLEPSPESLGGLDSEVVTCLSYRDHIIPWLERCSQLATSLPYVRETINQYINTLRQITNRDMASNQELLNLVKDKNNIAAALAIHNCFDNAVNCLMNDFLSGLKEALVKENSPFTCITKERDNWQNDNYLSIQFIHKCWENVAFWIEFEGKYLSDMILGLHRLEDRCNDIQTVLDAKTLIDRLDYYEKKGNNNWLYGYSKDSNLRNWHNEEALLMLADGRMIQVFIKFLKEVEEKSVGLLL